MAMLSFVFGFNARISRLQFLLASLALGLAMAVFVFFFAFAFGLQGASRMRPVDIVASWPVLIAIAVFLFATFTLQSMRFRDIGREHSHTAVGALVNLGLYLALLSWPGGEFSELRQSGATSPPPPPSPDRSAARLGAVTGATAGFGRRTR
jgi:uncharacterized membrane protein YhaH (DUF805 family)